MDYLIHWTTVRAKKDIDETMSIYGKYIAIIIGIALFGICYHAGYLTRRAALTRMNIADVTRFLKGCELCQDQVLVFDYCDQLLTVTEVPDTPILTDRVVCGIRFCEHSQFTLDGIPLPPNLSGVLISDVNSRPLTTTEEGRTIYVYSPTNGFSSAGDTVVGIWKKDIDTSDPLEKWFSDDRTVRR